MYLLFSEIVTVVIYWQRDFVSSNSVCNYTHGQQIRLPLRGHPILLISHMTTDRIGLPSVLLALLIIGVESYSVYINLFLFYLFLFLFFFWGGGGGKLGNFPQINI